MSIEIIKRGRSKNHNNREFIVVQTSGDTKLADIVRKFGKEYYPGALGQQKVADDKYQQIFFKRDKPLKSVKEIKNFFDW